MPDYIDREALLAHLFSKQDEEIDVAMEIARFPPAGVAPVKRGEWIDNGFVLHGGRVSRWTCSLCRCDCGQLSPYCPNCGAKMMEG